MKPFEEKGWMWLKFNLLQTHTCYLVIITMLSAAHLKQLHSKQPTSFKPCFHSSSNLHTHPQTEPTTLGYGQIRKKKVYCCNCTSHCCKDKSGGKAISEWTWFCHTPHWVEDEVQHKQEHKHELVFWVPVGSNDLGPHGSMGLENVSDFF